MALARPQLATLREELRVALPDGGALAREVEAIAAACDLVATR